MTRKCKKSSKKIRFDSGFYIFHVLRIFCCFQVLDRVFLKIRSDRRYLYK
ncbi:hypothetical protein LINGRAHAP2_LOCUS10972, partial [Linum grandiflorum]